MTSDPYAPAALLRNVRVVPLDRAPVTGPVDLRIHGGRVTQVAPGLRPRADERVHDAAGRWAIPGLWDSHVHLAQWGLVATRLDLSGTAHPREVLQIVREHVAGLTGGGVVYGYGYRSAGWPQRPTVAALDEVSAGRPVVLVSADVHNGWLSSRALELLGLAPRDTTVEENEWFEVFSELPDLGDQTEAGLARAAQDAAAAGVVGVVDMELAAGYRDWPERFARGVDQLRVRTATYPDRLDEVASAGVRSGQVLPGGAGLLTMGPLKIIFDGSLNTGTAYCCTPYGDGPVPQRGRLNYASADVVALLDRAHRLGLTAAVHAIGDAAVSAAIDAFELTGVSGSIEHAQLVATNDLPRMARLGLVASVQPAHLLDDRDVSERCWPDRTGRCFPLRSLHDAGVVLRLGSDAPVSPLDPWLAMSAAVHRSADARGPWHPEQALTPLEALVASTDGQGTLGVGSRGDVVLLDHDPLAPFSDSAQAGAQLRATRVAATFVAGRPTHLDL